MNITRLLTIAMVTVFALTMTSCAITNPYSKKFTGTWVAQKAGPWGENEKTYNPDVKPQMPKRTDTAQVTGRDGKGGVTRTPEEIEIHRQQRYHTFVNAESRSQIKVIDKKRAQKIYPGKTIDLRYKFKKKGTKLVVKDKEHGRFTADVIEFTDNSLFLIEHFEIGDIQVKYFKK